MAGVQACSLSTCLLTVGVVRLAHIPFPLRSVVAGNEFFTLNILSRFNFYFLHYIFACFECFGSTQSKLCKFLCARFLPFAFHSRSWPSLSRVHFTLIGLFFSGIPFLLLILFLLFLLSGRVYLGCGLKRSPVISGDLVFHCLLFSLGGG